jgi:hypothetical protein
VFITNVVKCRPPGNRDPEPDEIAACAGFLRRQLEVLDPAVVVTLGRYSMGTFMPGVRISQVHGSTAAVDPATGARNALVLAMYHPAAALRTPALEEESYRDNARVPETLVRSRGLRAARDRDGAGGTTVTALPPDPIIEPDTPASAPPAQAAHPAAHDSDGGGDQMTLF